MGICKQGKRLAFGSLSGQIYNNCMISNYSRLTDLLEKTVRGELVRMVQKELENMAEDPLIIDLLAMAVADPNLSHNTRLAAAIYLNRTITEHYHELQQPRIIEQLVIIFFNLTIDFKYKHALQNAFVALIELAESRTIEEVFIFIGDVIKTINSQNSRFLKKNNENSMEDVSSSLSIELQKIHIIFYIYKCVLDACSHNDRLFDEVQSTLPTFITLVPTTNDPSHVRTLYRMVQFLAAFMEKVNQSAGDQLDDCFNWFSTNEALLAWVMRIYSLNGVRNSCWLSLQPQLNPTELNDLKVKTAELHCNFLVFLHTLEFEDCPIVETHIKMSHTLMNTLEFYSAYQQNLFHFQGFVTGLVKCLVRLYQQRRQIFSPIYATLLHKIVFPMLATKEVELRQFQQDPQQFFRITQDCCDHQRFGILKTDIASLLETICDDNEEAATYVIQHCIISLKVRLSLDQNFESQAKNFLSIETALLALSIQSYNLSKFNAELTQLKKLLTYPNVSGRLGKLQLCRLFAFLAYNYNELFKNALEGQDWVRLALVSDQHPTVQIFALDFITNVIEDYFSISFLRDFAVRSLSKGSRHLNAFIKMISVHMAKVQEEDMVFLIDILIKITARAIEMYLRKERPHSMDVSTCLNTLRKIIEKDNYIKGKPLLVTKMWEIVQLMNPLQRLDLDDSLVRLITCFLNREKQLSQKTIAIIEPIIKLYQMQRLQKTAFLIFINQIIIKGAPTIAVYLAGVLVPAFIKIKDQGISDIRVTKQKVAIGTILIIMQNALAYHGNDMPHELIDQFWNLAAQLVPPDDSPEDKYDNILVARALNLLFLCHMYRPNEQALRKLLLFQDAHIFVSYDLRVLCLCLAKQILREKDVVSVTEMIILMVKAISLSKMETTTITAKKNPFSIKHSSTKIRIKRIDEYEYILKSMLTPFPDEQPQKQLQDVIQKMKKVNYNLYQAIMKSLPKVVCQKLKEQMTELIVDGKKRRIIHAGAPRENGQLPNETIISKGPKKRGRDNSQGQQQQEEGEGGEQMDSKKRNLMRKKLKKAHHQSE